MERKRKGNLNCCVRVCKNTFSNTTTETKFFTFPMAPYKIEKREAWKRWIRKTNGTPNWEPKVGTRICSDHFGGYRPSSMPKSIGYAPYIIKRKELGMVPEETSTIQRFEKAMEEKVYTSKHAECSVNEENVQANVLQNCGEPSPPIKFKLTELSLVPRQIDKSFQIEIFGTTPEHKVAFNGVTTFICMQYVRNGVCEAQTQVFIHEKPTSTYFKHKKKNYEHKCVGTSTARIDKCIGPDLHTSRKAKTGSLKLASISNDQEMLETCGVTMNTFELLINILPKMSNKKISKEDRLFLLLTKLKTGTSYARMSVMYPIQSRTISQVFKHLTYSMRVACERYVQWPSQETVRNSMPDDFKQLYGDCRVMINCMKITLQPGTTIGRELTDSNYGASTKFLVGYTPSGLISFVSSCYNGLASDCDVIKDSGILNLLEPGDVVLSNKEFPEIQKALHENGNITLKVIPPFLRNSKFSADDVDRMYQNVRVKNHYERYIQRLKFYKVFHKVSVDMLDYIPDMFFICCALANLELSNLPSENKSTQYEAPTEDDYVEGSEIADGLET